MLSDKYGNYAEITRAWQAAVHYHHFSGYKGLFILNNAC